MTDNLLERATKELAISRLATLILEAKGGSAKAAEQAAARMKDRISVAGSHVYVTDASGAESSLAELAIEDAGAAPAPAEKAKSGYRPAGTLAPARAAAKPDPELVAEKARAIRYNI